MPQKMDYWVDKRVTFHWIAGDVTAAEFLEANATAVQLVRNGIGPVHHVVDATGVGKVSLNLRQLGEITSLLREPNLGWIVFIGGNPIVRFLAAVLTQHDRVKFRVVDDQEAAWQLLQRVDSSLTAVLPAGEPIVPHHAHLPVPF
jgi:hypothetical protein